LEVGGLVVAAAGTADACRTAIRRSASQLGSPPSQTNRHVDLVRVSLRPRLRIVGASSCDDGVVDLSAIVVVVV
jgi:hypothetical protein